MPEGSIPLIATDYIQCAVSFATKDLQVPVWRTREPDSGGKRSAPPFPEGVSDYGATKPAVIWRHDLSRRDNSLNGPSSPIYQLFEIECRSDTALGANNMAEDILYRFEVDNRLLILMADYDEHDDPSQQKSKYYSHILEVGLAYDGDVPWFVCLVAHLRATGAGTAILTVEPPAVSMTMRLRAMGEGEGKLEVEKP